MAHGEAHWLKLEFCFTDSKMESNKTDFHFSNTSKSPFLASENGHQKYFMGTKVKVPICGSKWAILHQSTDNYEQP